MVKSDCGGTGEGRREEHCVNGVVKVGGVGKYF